MKLVHAASSVSQLAYASHVVIDLKGTMKMEKLASSFESGAGTILFLAKALLAVLKLLHAPSRT